jgi:spermidine/putrescine transport system substrate-binding protein
MEELSRRKFLEVGLKTLGCSFPLALAGCGQGRHASNTAQLNILNWADYIDPQAVTEFERRYQVEVIYDTFASNEALLAKLQAGGAKYDIIVPSSYMVKQLKDLELLSVLEHDRISGTDALMENFQHCRFDPGLQYCLPYTWGTTGIGYNKPALRQEGFLKKEDEPLGWEQFFAVPSPSRMTLLDDAREVLGMALKVLGYSYNSTSERELKEAVDKLVAQKSRVMCYTSEQVIVELASGDSFFSQVFSGDAYQAMRENSDLAYSIPREGSSIWTDNFCILKSAPHKLQAYQWLNYMLEPEVAAACANYTNYATANARAWPLINQELKDDPNLYPGEKVRERLEELGDIGRAVFLYDRFWTELKCA